MTKYDMFLCQNCDIAFQAVFIYVVFVTLTDRVDSGRLRILRD